MSFFNWNRKVFITDNDIELKSLVSPLPKKEFENMLELLRDAEKYDSSGEFQISKDVLGNLVKYIQNHIKDE